MQATCFFFFFLIFEFLLNWRYIKVYACVVKVYVDISNPNSMHAKIPRKRGAKGVDQWAILKPQNAQEVTWIIVFECYLPKL